MTKEFIIARTFDAPVELVWRAWTEPKLFAQWFGPKGFKSETKAMDIREGGVTHSKLISPDGHVMWGKFIYREVKKPLLLSWEHFFSDETGGVTRHPLQPHWPLKLLTTVTLEAVGNQTKQTLVWVPLEATDIERKAFEDNMPTMHMGWGGTFEQLDAFLKEADAA
jgi:uncharacterized protein YndB with AHSA1/START domain